MEDGDEEWEPSVWWWSSLRKCVAVTVLKDGLGGRSGMHRDSMWVKFIQVEMGECGLTGCGGGCMRWFEILTIMVWPD